MMPPTAIAAVAPLPSAAPPTKSGGEPPDGFASALETARTAPAEGHTPEPGGRPAAAPTTESDPTAGAPQPGAAEALAAAAVAVPVQPVLVPVVDVTGAAPGTAAPAAAVADPLAALLGAVPASTQVAVATAPAETAAAVLTGTIPVTADAATGEPVAPVASTPVAATAPAGAPAATQQDGDGAAPDTGQGQAGQDHAPDPGRPQSAAAKLEAILTGATHVRSEPAATAAATAEPPAAAGSPAAPEAPPAPGLAAPAAATTGPAGAAAAAPSTTDAPTAPTAAAPAPAQPTTSAPSQPVREVPLARAPESVGAMLQMAARDGVHRAKLNLRPATLGGVEIRMQQTAAGLVAHVVADNPEAARMLAAAGADLRRTLEQQGVNVLSLDVSTSGEQQPGAASAHADHQFGAGDRSGTAAASRTGLRSGDGAEDSGATADHLVQTVQLPDGVLVDVLA